MKIAVVVPDNRDEFRRYADPAPHFGTAPTALLDGFAALPECEVHVVCCVQQPVAAPEKIGPNIYYHTEIVPKWGWLRGGYLGCIRSIRRQLQKIQPDIVHGQGTERYCALSAVFSGFPNVLTIHGNMRLIAQVNGARPFSFQWLAARLEGFTLPRADGVVCITRYTREAVADLAWRTWVVPNAVNREFFEVNPAPDPERPPVILCVGAVCYRKNQNDFIRALDPLARANKIKLVFLGQTDKSDYCQEFFELVRARDWCEHQSFASHDHVKALLCSATMSALPTREDNCPMVVLEAMAAGVPVLASNVGGVPDLIEHEKTGLFCDPQRPESFREGVARLLGEPKLGRQLVANAKAEAQRRFHPQVVARRHLEIYREVIQERSAKS
jgi:glycosyltransferase involved in cell wall biosynthesis